MKKIRYILIVLILFVASCNVEKNNVSSQNSTIDLSNRTFDNKSVYELQGKWEFYWDTLLTPNQINTTTLSPELVEIPATWASYGKGHKGVATYHARLKLKPNRFYTLTFRRIYLAHKLWVNGKEYPSLGVVSKDPELFEAYDIPQTHEFFAENEYVDIVFQLANQDYRKGGMGHAIVIGTPKATDQSVFERLTYEIFTIGGMLFAMIFLLYFIFFGKTNAKEIIYLMSFLLFQSLAVSLDGEIIMGRIVDIPWLLESKLWYLSVFLRSLFLFLVVSTITKDKFNQTIKRVAIYFTLLSITFVIVSPLRIYTHVLRLYVGFGIISVVYGIVAVVRSLKADKYLILTLLGLSVVVGTGIYDSLLDFSIIKGNYIAGIGLFIFTLLQMFYISIRNANKMENDDFKLSNLDLQGEFNATLMGNTSFDIESSMLSYIRATGVDKVLVFFVYDNKLYLKYKFYKDFNPITLDEEIDLYKKQKYFWDLCVKKVFEKEEAIYLDYVEIKKQQKRYLTRNKVRNLFVIPVKYEGKKISMVYIEKQKTNLTKVQENVVLKSQNVLQNILRASFLYSNLQKRNQNLKQEIAKKREKIEYQNNKIEFKNQELNEKIQLIEEQLAILQEVSEDISQQNLNLELHKDEAENAKAILEEDKSQLEIVQKAIYRNINYASILIERTRTVEANPPFEYYYHFNKPRGVVGGDFLWSKQVKNRFVFALADSTGHGIPGALLVLFGTKLLINIVAEHAASTEYFTAADLLEEMRRRVKKHLTDKKQSVQDGYDMSMCVYNPETKEISIAGANNGVIIVRNKKIIRIKPNRMPVGAYLREIPFKNNCVQLQKDDNVYLFTDGYIDQYGGPENTKFYMVNFQKLLVEISDKSPNDQLKILEETFDNWRGKEKQIDDVSVACFKV